MTELRSRHLVERAALLLREDLRLAADSPPAPPPHVAPPEPTAPPAVPPPPSPDASPPAAAEAPAASQGEAVAMPVLQAAGLVLGGRSRSRVIEEFSVTAGALLRGLRSAAREPAATPGAAPAGFANLLLVTSARPGEGKTFSALNLAATLAHNGLARVVLADIDSKPASLTAQLGLAARRGLFDIAADPAVRPDAMLVETAIRDLSVLPLGTRDAAPAGGAAASGQGLMRRITVAVERVARRLEGRVIVLDAPPCLATSEPAALAPMVGLVALVVEAERTQRHEIETALDLVSPCPAIMLVLNKIRGASGHAFGYYDYYGS